MRSMLRVVVSLVLILGLFAGIQAQDASNVSLEGRWAYGPSNAVCISGNHAFVATGGYLEIWQVTGAGAPAFVSHLAMPKPLLDITVNGTDVYAVDGDSLYVISIITIGAPVRKAAMVTPGNARAVTFYVNGGTDYVGIADGIEGVRVIDVDDPTAPAFSGVIDPGGKAVSVKYFDGSLCATFIDNSTVTDNKLRIYNVDDPATAIVQRGHYTCTYPLDADYVTLSSVDYAIIADSTRLFSIIITDPTAPVAGTILARDSAVSAIVIGDDGTDTYAFLGMKGATLDIGRIQLDTATPVDFSGGIVDAFASDGKAAGLAFEATGDDIYAATGLGGLQSYNFNLSALADVLNADGGDGNDAGTHYYGAGTITDVNAASSTVMYVTDIDDGLKKIDTWGVTVINTANFNKNANGLDLYNDTLYVASGGVGVQRFTTADITTRIDVFDTDGSAYNVFVDNGYAYVADGSNGLVIIDVTDFTTEAGHVTSGLILQSGDLARDVWVHGNYAYVAVGFGGVYVVDVTNKAAPTVVRSIAMDGEDVLAVTGDALGDYLYVANGVNGVEIISISTPATATLVTTFNTGGSAKDVKVYESYLYVADGSAGFRSVNVYNPATPHEEGYYDTGDDARGIFLLDHENVFVADGNDGVYEFDNVLAHNVHFVTGGTYRVANPTGRSIPVVIKNAQILGDDALVAGDEIAIIDSLNLVVGRTVYQGFFPVTITVWMRYYDSNSGTVLPGAYEGNNMIFKIWNSSTDEVLGAFPTYTIGDGVFSDTQLLTVVDPLTAYDLTGPTPVAPTGSYMTVNVYDNITVNGEGIDVGDEILVYDASLCVGSIRYNGAAVNIPVWLAMTIPPGSSSLPGANRDHFMTFMVYDSSEATVNPTTATFAEGTTGKFGQNVAVVTQLASYTTLTQQIVLDPAKLNLISFNVDPVADDDQAIDAMLDDVTNLAICQDDAGNYFMPGAHIDQIGQVDLTKGYQVYHDNAGADTVVNEGNRLVPNEIVLNLTASKFYMVGFPYQYSKLAASVFASLGSNLIVLQDESDGSYWIPAYNINDIDNSGGLVPGRGYKLYVDATITFTYPGLPDNAPKALADAPVKARSKVTHFNYHESGSGYAVVIKASETNLKNGDEVGLFAGGRCVGAAVFEGQYSFAVSAWESVNMNSLDIPGFVPGDAISVKIWDSSNNYEYPVPVISGPEGALYGNGPLAVISLGKAAQADLLPQEFGLDQNYPNPFNPETTIKYHLPESGNVKIMVFNSVGQQIKTLVDTQKEAGNFEIKWNGLNDKGAKVSSGVYIVRLKVGSVVKNIKMLLMQ